MSGPKPNVERREEIARMRREGMTYAAIGAALIPPITAEGVRVSMKAARTFKPSTGCNKNPAGV